ncbi:MAG: thiosulfate oxidation carrier complex protein SoxZ [Chromatiales bacterium]|nr:thiosulfate oxidation carrier complex protein SoxZ [Chromatiales bacterium]
MKIDTRMRVRKSGEQARVTVLVRHPMGGADAKAAFIEHMRFEVDGQVSAEAYMGPGVAANPITGVVLSPVRSGQRVVVHWRDSAGNSGSAESVLP